MKKITVLGFLLLSLMGELAFADAYYVRSQAGSPWGKTSYEIDMDIVFGAGNWVAARYESVNSADLFSSANEFIYLEGGATSGPPLRDFIAANKTKMEDWVFGGGTLFVNSAPWGITTMDLGFGVTLHYPDYTPTGISADPTHTIFNGPFGATGNTFTGNYFGHSTISGAGLTPLIVNSTNGKYVLAEITHGRGVAFFGGVTAREFHSPKPQVSYLQQNIRMYQATIKGATLSYSRRITMNPGDNTNVVITLNNRDDFAINAVISYQSDDLSVSGPSILAVPKEDGESISVNIGTSIVDEGSHTVEVQFELDQGETFTAEIIVDIVAFEQLTPNTSFNSYAPDLSADGNLMVFSSNADLAGTSKPTSARDVFLYNKNTDTYQQLTSNPVARICDNPVISGNGLFVAAFCNSSLDISQTNPDASYELYYFDLTLNTVKQVNANSNAVMHSDIRQIAINHEGDLVYFSSNSDLDSERSNADGSAEVFVFNSAKNEVRQLTNFNYSSNDVKSISTDYEGKRFVVSSRGNPLGYNSRRYWRAFAGTLNKGLTHQITMNNNTRHTEGVVLSGNGEFVAIQSQDDLEPGQVANNRNQIFRSDFEGKSFKQITLSASYHSYDPAISNDGNRIVFRSQASLDGVNSSSNYEVFMHENKENRLRAMTEVNQGNGASLPRISADGSSVVFQGSADWISGRNPLNNNQIFFQSNLGSGPVTRYEDPIEQFAQNFLPFTLSEEDEEEIAKIKKTTTGHLSWFFIAVFGLLAFRRKIK